MAASLPRANFKEIVSVVQYLQIHTIQRGKLHKQSIETFGEKGILGAGAHRHHKDHVMQYNTSHCDTIQLKRFAFAVAFIPGKDAVLNAVAHQ